MSFSGGQQRGRKSLKEQTRRAPCPGAGSGGRDAWPDARLRLLRCTAAQRHGKRRLGRAELRPCCSVRWLSPCRVWSPSLGRQASPRAGKRHAPVRSRLCHAFQVGRRRWACGWGSLARVSTSRCKWQSYFSQPSWPEPLSWG